jgi:Taurine catabolism dioxygenase TauD, TfdA family
MRALDWLTRLGDDSRAGEYALASFADFRISAMGNQAVVGTFPRESRKPFRVTRSCCRKEHLSSAAQGTCPRRAQEVKISVSNDPRFLAQSEEFVELALKGLGYDSFKDAAIASAEPPVPLSPIIINDFRALTESEKQQIRDAFYGEHGTAYYIVRNHQDEPRFSHIILDISEQLTDYISVAFPLDHEKDVMKRRIDRLDADHGVVEVYDQGGSGVTGSDALLAHQAGLGSCGTIATTIIHADVAPHFGGFTYFQNVVRSALALAAADAPAFQALFHPDTMTVQRNDGEPGLRIQTPVLFVNTSDEPQSIIQSGNRGYVATWRPGDDVARGRAHIESILRSFAPGSCFVHFTSPGQGIITRNAPIAHGRTPFGDIDNAMPARRLARKWYAISSEFTTSRQAPGLVIKDQYAQLYPRFYEREGCWRFDADVGDNVRMR